MNKRSIDEYSKEKSVAALRLRDHIKEGLDKENKVHHKSVKEVLEY
jgi:hypothetical protein